MTSAVVICTRNRPDPLAHALAALRSQRRSPQLVVVVDASDVGPRARVADLCARYGAVLTVASVPSLTAQRNRGMCLASEADLVIFIDDDVTLDPTYIEAMEQLFTKRPELVAASGRTIDSAMRGPSGVAKRLFWRMFYGNTTTKIGASVGPTVPFTGLRMIPTKRLTGCNMVLRNAAVGDRPIFDESMIGYGLGEDVVVSLRLAKIGGLMWHGEATAHHVRSSVGRQSLKTFRQRLEVWGGIREEFKLGGRCAAFCLAWGRVGHAIEAGVRRLSAGEKRG